MIGLYTATVVLLRVNGNLSLSLMSLLSGTSVKSFKTGDTYTKLLMINMFFISSVDLNACYFVCGLSRPQ